jgi:hypothetical protein
MCNKGGDPGIVLRIFSPPAVECCDARRDIFPEGGRGCVGWNET